MHRLCLTIIIVILPHIILCQLFDDFSSSDLSLWNGDVNLFEINDENRLQLADDDSGEALLYRALSYPDSIEWLMDIELQFAPSTSNALNIILAVDQINLDLASGYMISIGQSGNDDAIQLIEIDQGTQTVIAEGIMGQVSQAFHKKIHILYNENEEWIIRSTDYNTLLTSEELTINKDLIISPAQMQYFGIKCQYTSSRSDKFFFDNISIDEIKKDTIPPQLISAEISSDTTITLVFDEALSDVISIDNFSLSDDQSIKDVVLSSALQNTVIIITDDPIIKGQYIDLRIDGISDVAGNKSQEQTIELIYYLSPDEAQLHINEILFNPVTGGSDYVEIINNSDKIVDLRNLIIANTDKNTEKIITQSIILEPKQIIAMTSDKTHIIDTYQPLTEAIIIETDLPSFNDDEGNVTLMYDNGSELEIIDSFDYNEDYHQQIIADREGISLERISLMSPTNDANNWTSASADYNYGTPGYVNSAAQDLTDPSEDKVFLEYKTFTPNLDGDKDFLIIRYNLEQSGYVLTAKVLDDKGRHETDLSNNNLLGTRGILRWDGNKSDGNPSPTGMYIIFYELFHPDGQVIRGKEVCVLSRNLD